MDGTWYLVEVFRSNALSLRDMAKYAVTSFKQYNETMLPNQLNQEIKMLRNRQFFLKRYFDLDPRIEDLHDEISNCSTSIDFGKTEDKIGFIEKNEKLISELTKLYKEKKTLLKQL